MPKKVKSRVGEKYMTNEGYEIEITKHNSNIDCSVMFKEGCIIENIQVSQIISGQIKNPYHPSVYGVGYIGQGKYKSRSDKKVTNHYRAWNHMLERCYSHKRHQKQPTYKDCIVVEKWHNFQNFAEWFENNYIEGWQLDKDILIEGNKVYSPETCCFVPQEINKLLIKINNYNLLTGIEIRGVKKLKYKVTLSKNNKQNIIGYFDSKNEASIKYIKEKEDHIKEMAYKYKNVISKKVYDKLINFKISKNE